MASEFMSSSLEDYLEAIAELNEENGHAHSKDIAARLKVKMPSVTNALQALAARDLIVYQSHLPAVLTHEGKRVADLVRRRHAGLRRFFSETLRLPEHVADAAACKIEHVIGENEMARLTILGDAIAGRKDCAELRAYLEETFDALPDAETEILIALDQLPEGASGMIAHVGAALRGRKKFADLGLVPGTVLTMEGRAPFGDLLRVRVMGSTLSLRSGDAAYILLKKHPVASGYFKA